MSLLKQCPACGTPVPYSKGEKAEYLRFDCPTHGSFQIHERMANHLIKPEVKPQMKDLSNLIAEKRKSYHDGLLTITNNYRVKEVDRSQL